MGKPSRRVNPKVATRVNQNLKEWTLKEAVKFARKLPPPYAVKERGRPPADPRVVAVLCLFRVSCNLTYDGYAAERSDSRIQKILGVSQLPSRSALHRGMGNLSQKYLRRFNKILTGRLVRKKGLRVIVDSTGVGLRSSSMWYDIRVKRRNKRKDNAKLHLAVDPRRNVVLNFKITSWKKGDSPVLGFLLRTLDTVSKVLGDSGYLSRKNCDLVVEKDGKPFFKLKANTTAKAKGSKAWKDMVRFAREHKALYERIYHVRSLVESVNSAIKRRYGSFVRAVKRKTRNNAIALKIIAYNVKQLLYDKLASHLRVPYWITC